MCNGNCIELPMYTQNPFLEVQLDFRKIITDLDIPGYSI